VECTRGSPKSGLRAGFRRNVGADAFELAAANVLQVLPFGHGRGGFIKIDRNLKAFPYLGSNVARHGYAVFDGDASIGIKGTTSAAPMRGWAP